MSDFYLILPSNSSMDYYPDNTAAHYYTKLPETIDLSRGDYEVGLAEIQLTSYIANLEEQEGYFKVIIHPQEGEKLLFVPKAMYKDTIELVETLDHMIWKEFDNQKKKHPKMKERPRFEFNPITRKVMLKLSSKHHKVEMNDILASMLHMNKTYDKVGRHIAKKFIDVFKHTSAVYIYCDLVRHRIVGDAIVPLLRVVPTFEPEPSTIHVIYETPHYIPISHSQFDTIEILLSTDSGKSSAFSAGHTIATLHIRPRKI